MIFFGRPFLAELLTTIYNTIHVITSLLGKGSLQTSHNIHESHSRSQLRGALNSLTGGVCHWVNQSLACRIVHNHSDHLGRFAIALIHGPRNQGIALVTAYRPVDGANVDISVATQHCWILGASSDPRERCLQDLLKQILDLQQKGYSILLVIDANEPTSDDLFPSKGLNLFLKKSGLIDPIEQYHGRCPFLTSSARQGSPTDLIFCSEDLLPFVETGILGEDQGATSNHQGIALDLDLYTMWALSEEPQQEPRPRGFRSNNTFKSFEYINTLMGFLNEKEVISKVEMLFQRIHLGEYDAQLEQACLVELDDIITEAMLRAEDEIRPSRTATSHTWSPELVLLQKKANLLHHTSKWINNRGCLNRAIYSASIVETAIKVCSLLFYTGGHPPSCIKYLPQFTISLQNPHRHMLLSSN